MKLASPFVALLFLLPYCAAEESPVAPSPSISGVGSITDPLSDSRIEGDSKRLTIALSGGDYALDIERNRMQAPRVLQEVSGDFTAEVTVSGTYPQETATEVKGRRPFQGAGLLLWVSPQTYIRLERAQVKFEAEGETHYVAYPSWELRFEGKALRMATGADGRLSGPKTMFRITRTGNKVVAALSEDGTAWRELDPLTVKLPEKVQIGVAAGHNTTKPFEATFEDFSVKAVGEAQATQASE